MTRGNWPLDIIDNLLFRFKEREENVKADIFHAYQALLRQTKPSTSASINVNLAHDNNRMEAEEGPVTQLQAQVASMRRGQWC